MAHVQELPDGALDAIAKQVGRLYPSLDNNVTQYQPSAELRETFSVWFLSVDEIAIGNDNLLEIAQDTNRWHSQIWIDGKPKGVVRFMGPSEDASNWTVTEVLKGDLVETVEDIVGWIDREIKADPLVHILEIPALFITAFWLIDEEESSVVIAKLPEYLQSLSPLVQYSSENFLEVLRREPYAVGIRNEQTEPPRQGKWGTPERDTFNVLSIGGDGIDDIVPAMVLAEIEERTGLSTADNFDFITGNSTGRVLALGLGARDDDGKPEYKAKDLVGIYENLRNDIFKSSGGDVGSFLTKGYLHKSLESVLGSYFQSPVLGDILEKTRAVVSYYDIGIGAWTPAIQALNVASAVSMGPTFLSPVVSVYAEAKRIISEAEPFKHFQDSDIFVLSLGDAQAITDFQRLSSLGHNFVPLHTPLSEVSVYADRTSKDNITDPRNLADALIESPEFREVCKRLID